MIPCWKKIIMNETVLLLQESIANGKIHYDNCIIFHCYVPKLNLETIVCLRLSKKYFWKNNKIFSNLPIVEKGKSGLNQLSPCLVSAYSPKLRKVIHETLDIIGPSVKVVGVLIAHHFFWHLFTTTLDLYFFYHSWAKGKL